MYETNIDRKGEKESLAIIVEDFDIPLSVMNKTRRQNISKETEELSKAINQFDPTYI